MPFMDMVIVALIAAAFTIFGLTLAWVAREDSLRAHQRSAPKELAPPSNIRHA